MAYATVNGYPVICGERDLQALFGACYIYKDASVGWQLRFNMYSSRYNAAAVYLQDWDFAVTGR